MTFRYLSIVIVMCLSVGWLTRAQDVQFTLDTPVEFVYREDLENENVLLPIQWATTSELTPETHVIIEQVLRDGDRVDVQIQQTEQWQILPGQAYIAPIAPDDLDTIVLSAQLVDEDRILAIANLIVAIESVADDLPEIPESRIAEFGVLDVDYNADGQLMAEVAFVVEDRPENTNLVFEQIVDDETVVNIEQARFGMIINASEGVGTGVLQEPSDLSVPIQLQLRLIDVINGRVLDVATAISETALVEITPQPTTIVTNPTPPPVNSTAQIISFTITPDPAERGGEIMLNWQTEGMRNVSITRLSETGQIFLESIANDLADSGSFAYQLPDFYTSQAEFVLIAFDDNEVLYQSYATVDLECPFVPVYDPAEPIDCPIEQSTTQIAVQTFERGMMIWRADSREIYVLFNNSSSYSIFTDYWTPDIVYDIPNEPPVGFIAPERGFGYLWATTDYVRDGLGWATGLEQSTTGVVETYLLPARYVEAVFLPLPDGRVVQIGSYIYSWAYQD